MADLLAMRSTLDARGVRLRSFVTESAIRLPSPTPSKATGNALPTPDAKPSNAMAMPKPKGLPLGLLPRLRDDGGVLLLDGVMRVPDNCLPRRSPDGFIINFG